MLLYVGGETGSEQSKYWRYHNVSLYLYKPIYQCLYLPKAEFLKSESISLDILMISPNYTVRYTVNFYQSAWYFGRHILENVCHWPSHKFILKSQRQRADLLKSIFCNALIITFLSVKSSPPHFPWQQVIRCIIIWKIIPTTLLCNWSVFVHLLSDWSLWPTFSFWCRKTTELSGHYDCEWRL